MKKIIAIALALVLLCGATAVLADTELVTPSKTTQDLISFTVEEVENPVEGKTVTMAPAADQAAAEAELEKAQNAKTVEAYFGEETTAAVKTILGEKAEISMDELLAVSMEGYEDGMGNVVIIAKFPTSYAKDEKVAVLIGVINDNVTAWKAVEGVGLEDGSVRFTVDPETALAIEEDIALFSVLSAK